MGDETETGSARWGQRAPPPGPSVGGAAEAFGDGIVEEVAPALVGFGFGAEAMIEEVGLPPHALKTRRAAFPRTDSLRHRTTWRERQHGMAMIRHEHKKTTPPSARFVQPRHAGDQRFAQIGLRERSRLSHSVNSDPNVIKTARGDPRWNVVAKSRGERTFRGGHIRDDSAERGWGKPAIVSH